DAQAPRSPSRGLSADAEHEVGARVLCRGPSPGGVLAKPAFDHRLLVPPRIRSDPESELLGLVRPLPLRAARATAPRLHRLPRAPGSRPARHPGCGMESLRTPRPSADHL